MDRKVPQTVYINSNPFPANPRLNKELLLLQGLAVVVEVLVNQVGMGSAFRMPKGMRSMETVSGVPTP